MQLSTFVQSIFNLDLLDLHGGDFPTWSEVGTNFGGKSESNFRQILVLRFNSISFFIKKSYYHNISGYKWAIDNII